MNPRVSLNDYQHRLFAKTALKDEFNAQHFVSGKGATGQNDKCSPIVSFLAPEIYPQSIS